VSWVTAAIRAPVAAMSSGARRWTVATRSSRTPRPAHRRTGTTPRRNSGSARWGAGRATTGGRGRPARRSRTGPGLVVVWGTRRRCGARNALSAPAHPPVNGRGLLRAGAGARPGSASWSASAGVNCSPWRYSWSKAEAPGVRCSDWRSCVSGGWIGYRWALADSRAVWAAPRRMAACHGRPSATTTAARAPSALMRNDGLSREGDGLDAAA
jgi:hypothetical protein